MWLALALLAPLARPGEAAEPHGGVATAPGGAGTRAPAATVPRRARDVLAAVLARQGEPPPGHVGGRAFQNRERKLPRGLYREYDVNPRRPGRPRDAERVVIETRTGKAYYSGDHYRTFVPMN